MKRSKGRRRKGPSRQKRKKKAASKRKAVGQRESGRLPLQKPYEFLDHPADVGFEARGKTLPELFASAAEAMCDCGWELDTVEPSETVTLRARAATLDDLLFSWLSEVLFLSDAEGWVFKSVTVNRVEETLAAPPRAASGGRPLWKVDGQARGEQFDRNRHRARTYIKAVTYHQLSVKKVRDGWQATVYLDV